MYYGEDGQLSWFNAGVRVGVGIGLGILELGWGYLCSLIKQPLQTCGGGSFKLEKFSASKLWSLLT
ncbi:hypothetical protein KY290_002319 [Solanum tuberosum]|uniref:Uncharacterized protein n=1 Tax=Solanum tuberosum TaxID=4113 RepID=A0ABQ7WPP7_SOLTU|nr:hypothetical protein KY284_002375 [Solanum tuberosum]KAH0766340.1 hypothetical protein KY285_002211 [Solanum tuberosum]KAH0782721.1 hypothetical protein KY290_002319 [Solanum tuberosum]